MVEFVNFASGITVRSDLVQFVMPSVTLRYNNELLTPAIVEETIFQVQENFHIDIEWSAEIEGIKEPIVVEVRNHKFSRTIPLKDYLAVMSKPLEAEEQDDIIRRVRSIRKQRENYLQLANTGNLDDIDAVREEYMQRAKLLRRILGTSKSGESFGIIKKDLKEYPVISSFIDLENLLSEKFGMNLSHNERQSLVLNLSGGEETNYYEPSDTEGVGEISASMMSQSNTEDSANEDDSFAEVNNQE